MPRNRLPSELFAIGWLFCLHALANVVVGAFRCHDLQREVTDVLAAALPRAQICLLAIWLALGKQRLSWRICGLTAGTSFIFLVYSRFLFPGEYGLGEGGMWHYAEWDYYLRLSGPGDLLARLPILLIGVALPLSVRRVWPVVRAARKAGRPLLRPDWSWLQFRFQDVALWTVTLSLALVIVFQTEPCPGWWRELADHLHVFYSPSWYFFGRAYGQATYTIASGWVGVSIAYVSLWMVYSKLPWWFRATLGTLLILLPAYAMQRFLVNVVLVNPIYPWRPPPLWGEAFHEIWTNAATAAVIVGSLLVVRAYGAMQK